MEDNTLSLRCRNCGTQTNHKSLFAHKSGSEPHDLDFWEQNHYLVKCLGCDTISYAISTTTEDDQMDAALDRVPFEPRWKIYPEPELEIQGIHRTYMLPDRIRSVYYEVIEAMRKNLITLSAVGLRMLVEAICVDQNIEGNDLAQRIDALGEEQVLTPAQSEFLHDHRFMGNFAAHEAISPSIEVLKVALEILESLMTTIFVLPRLSAQMKEKNQILE